MRLELLSWRHWERVVAYRFRAMRQNGASAYSPPLPAWMANRAPTSAHAGCSLGVMIARTNAAKPRTVGSGASLVTVERGGVLLSHQVPLAVPSALAGLASGFGMGPGVSPPL
jgi:hypothetical protein